MTERNVFRKNWITFAASQFKKIFDDADDDEILEFLNKEFDKDFVDSECICYNNYEKEEFKSTLSTIVDWIEDEKPILTESGTFFKRHSIAYNPEGVILQNKLDMRKVKKKEKFKYKQLAALEAIPAKRAEYKMLMKKADLAQSRLKTSVNSIYGVSGQKTSFIYNLCVAASTTQKGQMIISVSCETFENFVTDSVKFFDMDECLVYIDNIINEPNPTYLVGDYITKNISITELANRLVNKFSNPDDCNVKILMAVLGKLNKSQRNIVYYKNNLMQLMNDSPRLQKMMSDIILKSSKFIDPMKLPKETESLIKEFRAIMLDIVFYNHMVFDPRYRLQSQERETVRIIDTDSNFVDISKWVNYCSALIENKEVIEPFRHNGKYVIPSRNKKTSTDKITDDNVFVMVNTLAYVLSSVINDTLKMFIGRCNVEDGTPGEIVMKNEFYFPKILNTPAKKHYMGIYVLQEGVYMPIPEIEVKGMEYLKKAYASDEASNFIADLVYNDILLPKVPDMSDILSKISKFEASIKKSVEKGEFRFLKVAKVKTDDGYADPWSIGQWKAVKIWNMLYPDNKIELPGRAYILKVNLEKRASFGELSVTNPEIFKRLTHIFDSEPRVSKTGITTIGIPIGATMPDWIKPYVDVDTMVINNIKLVIPILEALDIETIHKNTDDRYVSNIIHIG